MSTNALNNIFGTKSSNINTVSSGAGKNSNTRRAFQLLAFSKQFENYVENLPTSYKVISFFASSFLANAIINYLIESIYSKLVFQIIFNLIILVFAMAFMNKPQVRYAILISLFISNAIWFIIFYMQYKKEKQDKNVGKKSFICNPIGLCKTDGTFGVHNGMEKYIYKDPDTGAKTPYIPGIHFERKNPNNFTLNFWLRVDYESWSQENMKKQLNPVLIKGSSAKSGQPSIFLDPNSNTIQFQAQPSFTPNPALLTTSYPFDKWVHYTMVFRQSVVELYKNGLLEKTVILQSPVVITRSNLFIGTTPENSTSNKGFLPGEMVFLEYRNNAMNPEDIDNLYKSELRTIESLPSPKKLEEETDEAKEFCKKCPDKCKKSNNTSTIEKTLFGNLFGNVNKDKDKNKDKDLTKVDINKVDTNKFDVNQYIPPVLSKYLDKMETFLNQTANNDIDTIYSSF